MTNRNVLMSCIAPLVVPVLLGSSSCRLIENPDYRERVTAEGSNILMRVVSAEGEPISLARVTVEDQVAFADAAGFVQFESLPVGRFHARIDAEGLTSAAVVMTMASGASPYEEPRLFPHPIVDTFDAGVEATILADHMRVVLPPNALVDPMGTPVTGMVDAAAVFVDPSQPNALDQLPSHLKAVAKSGEGVVLRSYMMADVGFSQEGVPLQIAPGQLARVELEFPPSMAPSVSVGDQISAWSLDLDNGSWVEEGMGTVELDESGDKVWVVYVSHFSWINCDLAVLTSELRCFAVSVQDANGNLIPDIKLTVTDEIAAVFKDGGTSYTVTDNQGMNCVVAQLETTQPTLHVGQLSSPLTTKSILTLLEEAGEGPSTTLTGQSGVCYTTGVESASGTGDDQMPAALNTGCTPLNIPLGSLTTQQCTPGEVRLCDYPTAYTDQLGQGICKQSKQYCINGGLTLTDCDGEVLPESSEDCTTLVDDDCDGSTDNYDTNSDACRCTSTTDSIQCYVGPPHTQDEGICTPGTSYCDGRGTFGPCGGAQQLPTTEDCLTTEVGSKADDENCDGEPACTGKMRSIQDTNVVLVDAASDKFGNIYALGYIDKGAVFTFEDNDTTTLQPAEKSTFVVKFNANDRATSFDDGPRVAWTKVLADPGGTTAPKPTTGSALTIYEDDNGVAAIYILGSFQGRLDENHVNDAGGADIFVARLNSAGAIEWVRSFGGSAPNDAVPTDAAVTGDGSFIYFSGYIYGAYPDFSSGASGQIDGTDPAANAADADAFILALDSSGATKWAKTYGSTALDSAIAIDIDSQGKVLVTGNTTSSFDAGNNVTLTATGANPYVLKLDTKLDGTDPENYVEAVWIRSIAANGGDARDLVFARDPSINADVAFVTGTTRGEDNDVYVGRYSSDGEEDFLRKWANSGTERGEAITVDSRGNVVLTGVFTNASIAYQGKSAMGTAGAVNVFVAKLKNGTGEPFWIQPSGTSQALAGSIRTVAVSRAYGDIYTMGASLFAELAP